MATPPKSAKDLEPIGKKIRKVRLEKKIELGTVANETGLSVDYLKKVESGRQRPPVGALLQIAKALGIDSGLLFREQESQMKQRIRAYTKRTDNYAYTTLTPGAENKHLKAFRVVVEARKDHGGVGYQHEGEEFVYVLKGGIEITVGDHVNLLEEGESLHFNSAIRHRMRNVGDTEAEMLVVIYNP
ncbi:MAG: helix-turn-helix domain-containing protein [Desulfobacterales bacterium]